MRLYVTDSIHTLFTLYAALENIIRPRILGQIYFITEKKCLNLQYIVSATPQPLVNSEQ